MITCPHCKFRELEGSLFCSNCGSPLIDERKEVGTTDELQKTTGVQPSAAPLVGKRTGPAPDVKSIRFVIQSSERRVTLGLQKKIILGRRDPRRGAQPELDLTDDGGAEAGVSRLHAEISATMQGISIMDLGSVNGTWVNDYRLEPNLPFALNDGDKLELGDQVLLVYFEG